MKGPTMNDSATLEDRIMQFRMLELPGQPRMMHMGTMYLVSDMEKEIERLRAALVSIEARAKAISFADDIVEMAQAALKLN